MPKTYAGRFRRTTTGRPLRGKAMRHNRQDLRALPVADFVVGDDAGAAPHDALFDFSGLTQAGAARGVTTWVIDNDDAAPVTEDDEATAQATAFQDYANPGTYAVVVTAPDETGKSDTATATVTVS